MPKRITYATPARIRNEKRNQAKITGWLPRGTISTPPLLTGGYTVPRIAIDPPGAARITDWQPRGSTNLGIMRGSVLDGHVFRGGLGDMDPTHDPVDKFGSEVADWISSTISQVPAPERKKALKALLDALEPGLDARVNKRARDLVTRGASRAAAVRQALETSLSDGLRGEFAKLSRTGVPSRHSTLGMVTLPGEFDAAQRRAQEGLGWSISGAIKSVGSGIKSGAGAVAGAASTAGGWVKSGVKAVGSAACKVASNPATHLAANIAAPGSGMGVSTAAEGLCNGGKSSTGAGAGYGSAAPKPFPIVPVVVAAGGVAALVILLK